MAEPQPSSKNFRGRPMDYADFLIGKLIVAAIAAGIWGFYRGWHGLPLDPGENDAEDRRE